MPHFFTESRQSHSHSHSDFHSFSTWLPLLSTCTRTVHFRIFAVAMLARTNCWVFYSTCTHLSKHCQPAYAAHTYIQEFTWEYKMRCIFAAAYPPTYLHTIYMHKYIWYVCMYAPWQDCIFFLRHIITTINVSMLI